MLLVHGLRLLGAHAGDMRSEVSVETFVKREKRPTIKPLAPRDMTLLHSSQEYISGIHRTRLD